MSIDELREAIKDMPGYLPVTISITAPADSGGVDTLHMTTSAATLENIKSYGGSLVIEPTGTLSEALEPTP